MVSQRGSPYAPATTDDLLPGTSDLVAGWYMIDVESQEGAVELRGLRLL
jgi:hypothetical protein